MTQTPVGLEWGYKFVGTDLTTNDHVGGRFRYRLGEWHEAPNPTVHSDPCPRQPGDGLCIARTLRGAQSGGARLGSSVMLLAGFDPVDVLATTDDKLRVSRLWVHPDPLDPVRLLIARGADLGGAYLRGVDLRGAYLGGADLGGAYLGGAYLGGAYLRGAYLRGAYLGGADLRGADLGGAYLGGAYLRGAYLRGAYLGGADLRGADLGGAYLPAEWTISANGYVVAS